MYACLAQLDQHQNYKPVMESKGSIEGFENFETFYFAFFAL